jgi:hypothetical protein
MRDHGDDDMQMVTVFVLGAIVLWAIVVGLWLL